MPAPAPYLPSYSQEDESFLEATQQTQTQTQSQPVFPPSSTAAPARPPEFWGLFEPVGGGVKAMVTFLNDRREYRFGRHGDGNEVVLAGKKISNFHCRVIRGGGGDGLSQPAEIVVILEDLSSNGTYVNGVKVGKGKRALLKHGDEISLGNPAAVEIHGPDDFRYMLRIPSRTRSQPIDEFAGGGVFARYEFGDQIGKGSFATVKKAYDRETGEMRAVKIIAKHRFAMNPKTVRMFEREVEILQELDHPNITRFINMFEDEQMIYIVMEYVAGGDLLDYIINRGGLDEAETKDITKQVCAGMAYTHSKGITHRDLKPENILLSLPSEGSKKRPQVKITDFGLAKAVDSRTYLKTMCGTPSYLAPEIVTRSEDVGYDQAVDSWSVGVIVYSMLCNASPFDEQEDEPLQERVLKRQVDYSILEQLNISPVGIDFIRRLLTNDPRNRMSLTAATSHPWLRDLPPLPSASISFASTSPSDTTAASTAFPPPAPTPLAASASMNSDISCSQDLGKLQLDTPEHTEGIGARVVRDSFGLPGPRAGAGTEGGIEQDPLVVGRDERWEGVDVLGEQAEMSGWSVSTGEARDIASQQQRQQSAPHSPAAPTTAPAHVHPAPLPPAPAPALASAPPITAPATSIVRQPTSSALKRKKPFDEFGSSLSSPPPLPEDDTDEQMRESRDFPTSPTGSSPSLQKPQSKRAKTPRRSDGAEAEVETPSTAGSGPRTRSRARRESAGTPVSKSARRG